MNNEPEDFARILLKELGIKRANNPEQIASKLRLEIQEVDFDNLEGALVFRVDRTKGIISINKNIKEFGRKQFTICHEIGHYVLPHHGSVRCGSKEIESWSRKIDTHEVEANRFASELLLPKQVIYPLVKNEATIDKAKSIANEFGTSLTSTLLKCSEVTDEECAVIWSVAGKIVWVKRNENFRFFIPIKHLDRQSVAFDLFSESSNLEGEKTVPTEAWLSNDDFLSDFEIWEDSILMPNYNGVLTLITLTK